MGAVFIRPTPGTGGARAARPLAGGCKHALQLAAGYAALKRDLVERLCGDREGYSAAKGRFISLVESTLDQAG